MTKDNYEDPLEISYPGLAAEEDRKRRESSTSNFQSPTMAPSTSEDKPYLMTPTKLHMIFPSDSGSKVDAETQEALEVFLDACSSRPGQEEQAPPGQCKAQSSQHSGVTSVNYYTDATRIKFEQ